ncbi:MULTISPECIES: hypothetical protein [Methylococcus]|uniref:Phage virion morphogenesis protein n=1 Tax=Methylococcus capsulatus TaxID=414 RepID=A0ABZ2F142_METCP|nr:hypothetical protein [Methylococcus sp. BF19-07]
MAPFTSSARNKRNSPIPWGDIPARPFIGLSDDDKNYIVETIEEHIKAAWG